MKSKYKHIAEQLRRDIEHHLNKTGLLYRVFSRGKDANSLNAKLHNENGKYQIGGKLLQDAVGIRIVLYFQEDVELVERLLISVFSIDRKASMIDHHATDQFTVSRHNLVLRLPTIYIDDAMRAIGNDPIDTTFEVQLRTVLSEGWHEVDHDLRYKSKLAWKGQDELSRALNGILATIETSEWSMRQIFEELAYRHYKNGNWAAMLHNRLRMRVQPSLSTPLSNTISSNQELAKDLFRIDRSKIIEKLITASPTIPINLDNLVFIWNNISARNIEITSITPTLILDALL